MIETDILSDKIINQESNVNEFIVLVQALIENFPRNRMCQKLDSGEFSLHDYHAFLNMIFHQTFEGPSTFAMAGANCDVRFFSIRDYLIQHAEEERSHWQWVIEDLRNTGYTGPDPRSLFPPIECQNYLAFNVYCAVRMPFARLGMAAFLEGVGASFGKKYAQKLSSLLDLKPHQLKFLFGHGDTDVGHFADIVALLDRSALSLYQWAYLCHAVKTSSSLYKSMYDGMVS